MSKNEKDMIKGVRAFGENEGALGHTGDFELLFQPLIPYLQDTAVFGPELDIGLGDKYTDLTKRIYGDNFSREEIARKELTPSEKEEFNRISNEEDELCEALETLKLAENVKESGIVTEISAAYYGPGFFPKYAEFLQDDWNNVICFKKPFPVYNELCDLYYTSKTLDKELRQRYRDLPFYMLFQNIDACYWEAYVPDPALYQKLIDYLNKKHIEYEFLDFDCDFPEGPLKEPRDFKDVHTIWPRGDD